MTQGAGFKVATRVLWGRARLARGLSGAELLLSSQGVFSASLGASRARAQEHLA
ncbi:MAG: hypothetical protein ACREAB_21495 [Blastocatellia bacterium]